MTQKEKDDLRLPDGVLEDETLLFKFNVVYEETMKQLIRSIGDKPENYVLYEVIAFESALRIYVRLEVDNIWDRPATDKEYDEIYQLFWAVAKGQSERKN